jgi:microcystin-dependent protein
MDYYLGSIELFPYNFVPMGWSLCDGSILQIQQNTALYSLLGIQFGGNGSTTFGLPNLLTSTLIPGMNFYICVSGIYPIRS